MQHLSNPGAASEAPPAVSKAEYCTHELVARQAALMPLEIAVRDPNEELSFGQLEDRANRLARFIKTLGVSNEAPVALYFQRSVDFVVACYAVLKAGGCYLPLDPGQPPQRIETILEDAGVRILLSHQRMAAKLAGGNWQGVDLTFEESRYKSFAAAPLETTVTHDDLAYVIYTSGSTGQPKGVEVTHGNLLTMASWHISNFSVSCRDRASSLAGLGFDATVWEIWCHLAAGASLHLIDGMSRLSAEAMKDWLVRERITLSYVPTVIAEQLISEDWPKETALRILYTAGERLHRFPKAGLPFTLENQYGPTECTVLVTSGPIQPGGAKGELPSIGRPVGETEILILDEDLRPVEAGLEGEICVAGERVARGYRNRPELTAKKFVQEPGTGRRLYRTGDRGRFLPSGEVAFAGRMDDQIKIRGFRVEPDEIALQLNTYPGVQNSVVVARGEGGENRKLAAYIVPRNGVELTGAELREYLKTRLPDYMIPAQYIRLESLPLSATGKCDKKALPAPAAESVLPEATISQARETGVANATEAKIGEWISELLDGRSIGQDENFFLAGGHSMLAAQLLGKIRQELAVKMSLRQLYDTPTLTTLSAAVERKISDSVS